MDKEIKFKKRKIIYGLLFFSLMLCFSITFVAYPEMYVRNVFMREKNIQVFGLIGILYFSGLVYSFLLILPRKYAFIISDDFLIDNSKYESLGKIKWTDISEVKKLKKNNIELSLKVDLYRNEQRNFLKRFLTFMHSWNYKKRILISSALTESSIEVLFKEIKNAHKTNIQHHLN